eukprot:4687679-Pyramimonas_sp.AAC.1
MRVPLRVVDAVLDMMRTLKENRATPLGGYHSHKHAPARRACCSARTRASAPAKGARERATGPPCVPPSCSSAEA